VVIAFLESDSYESAVRNAVSLGGDADAQACIAGGIPEAFYGGIPAEIEEQVLPMLPPDLRAVVDAFNKKFRGGDARLNQPVQPPAKSPGKSTLSAEQKAQLAKMKAQ
jgi:hypothetical protein